MGNFFFLLFQIIFFSLSFPPLSPLFIHRFLFRFTVLIACEVQEFAKTHGMVELQQICEFIMAVNINVDAVMRYNNFFPFFLAVCEKVFFFPSSPLLCFFFNRNLF